MDFISSSREQPIDRISSLPDPLLVHILSFLDMCEAVQTGILSSRWRGLWSSVPSLHFNQYHFNGYKEFKPATEEYPHQRYDKFAFHDDIDFDNYDDDYEDEDDYDYANAVYYGHNFHDTDDFIKFVDHSLALHVAPKVNKFSLTCSYSRKFESFIDGWILSAVRRDVKEVKLEFPECIRGLYNLPSWLFKCECLTSLSLKGCPVGVPQSVCLSSLLSLSISLTRMSVGSIPQLLTGCPLLEELVLDECQFSSGTLRILSLSTSSELRLKRLTIAWCTNQFDLHICFQIRAPYLEMLNISGIHPFDHSMKNLLNLREAHLDFSEGGWTPSVESCLKDLHHVRVIGLSRQCIKLNGVPTLFKGLPSWSYVILMSSSSRSSSVSLQNLQWAPKCPCGYGTMIPKTSRTTSNPGRKFWKCPDLPGERGCGLLIWMDELTSEWIPKSDTGSDNIDAKLEEMKSAVEEMRLGMRRLRESIDHQNRGSRRENGVAYMLVIIIFFVACIWYQKNVRNSLLELM